MAVREAPCVNCGDSGITSAAHAAIAFSSYATVSSEEVRVHQSARRGRRHGTSEGLEIGNSSADVRDEDTPELKAIQDALKKAKVAAQGIPLVVQLEQCQQFVAKCEKRVAALDAERSSCDCKWPNCSGPIAARIGSGWGSTMRVMVRDLDITPPHRSDLRRLEVVAEGLALFGGANWPLTPEWCHHSTRAALTDAGLMPTTVKFWVRPAS